MPCTALHQANPAQKRNGKTVFNRIIYGPENFKICLTNLSKAHSLAPLFHTHWSLGWVVGCNDTTPWRSSQPNATEPYNNAVCSRGKKVDSPWDQDEHVFGVFVSDIGSLRLARIARCPSSRGCPFIDSANLHDAFPGSMPSERERTDTVSATTMEEWGVRGDKTPVA